MYIKTLSITNLRCFEEVQLDLQHPERPTPVALNHPNVNLLLGNNGAGKSTILRAIALGILAPVIEGSGYVPYYLIRRQRYTQHPPLRVPPPGQRRGDSVRPRGPAPLGAGQADASVSFSLCLHEQDVGKVIADAQGGVEVVGLNDLERLYPIHTSVGNSQEEDIWDGMFDNDSPAFLLLGYGATRRVDISEVFDPQSQLKRRLLRYQRVAGLFEEHIALTPLGAWLPLLESQNPTRFQEILSLFRELLPPDTQLTTKGGREILFQQRGAEVPFDALSDGYRAYIAWLGDMLYHLQMACPPEHPLTTLHGIVLVDEIDLHLHPEWQREIVATLSQSFPNLQFVLTTHSPIVTGTLQPQNIFVMASDPAGPSTVEQYSEQLYGRTVDQVLQSAYFDLPTSRAPGFEEELRTIEERAWQGDPQAAVEYLRKLAGNSP